MAIASTSANNNGIRMVRRADESQETTQNSGLNWFVVPASLLTYVRDGNREGVPDEVAAGILSDYNDDGWVRSGSFYVSVENNGVEVFLLAERRWAENVHVKWSTGDWKVSALLEILNEEGGPGADKRKSNSNIFNEGIDYATEKTFELFPEIKEFSVRLRDVRIARDSAHSNLRNRDNTAALSNVQPNNVSIVEVGRFYHGGIRTVKKYGLGLRDSQLYALSDEYARELAEEFLGKAHKIIKVNDVVVGFQSMNDGAPAFWHTTTLCAVNSTATRSVLKKINAQITIPTQEELEESFTADIVAQNKKLVSTRKREMVAAKKAYEEAKGLAELSSGWLGRIAKDKRVKEVKIVGRNSLRVTTKPICMFGYKINEMVFEYDKQNRTLREVTGSDRDEYPHPHIGVDGNLCAGNISSKIRKALDQQNPEAVFDLLLALLYSYNVNSPYRGVETFPTVNPDKYHVDPEGIIVLQKIEKNAPEKTKKEPKVATAEATV